MTDKKTTKTEKPAETKGPVHLEEEDLEKVQGGKFNPGKGGSRTQEGTPT